MDLYEEFANIIEALEQSSAPYAVCGGLAVAFHGYPRFTKDIDLLVREEDLPLVKQAVEPLGYTVDAGPIPFDVGGPRHRVADRVSKIQQGEVLTLDLLVPSPALESIWNAQQVFEWEGRQVRIVSVDGLVRMKRLAGRRQDLLDIEKLGHSVSEEVEAGDD